MTDREQFRQCSSQQDNVIRGEKLDVNIRLLFTLALFASGLAGISVKSVGRGRSPSSSSPRHNTAPCPSRITWTAVKHNHRHGEHVERFALKVIWFTARG